MSGSCVEVARSAWGDKIPAWVIEIAVESDRASQANTAQRIGLSKGLVSSVLSNKYKGSLNNVKRQVEAHLMNAKVFCPFFGELARVRCDEYRTASIDGINSQAATVQRCCRECNNNVDQGK